MKNKELISVYILLIVLCMGCKCKEAVSPEKNYRLPPKSELIPLGFWQTGKCGYLKGLAAQKIHPGTMIQHT